MDFICVLVYFIDVQFGGEDDVSTHFAVASQLLEYFNVPTVVVDKRWTNHEIVSIAVDWINLIGFIANVDFFDSFVAFLVLSLFQQALAEFHAVDLSKAINIKVLTNITFTTPNI